MSQLGHFPLLADGEGLPRHKCLRRIRDDFAALCLQNLLIVEPSNFVSGPNPKSPFQHQRADIET